MSIFELEARMERRRDGQTDGRARRVMWLVGRLHNILVEINYEDVTTVYVECMRLLIIK